jgi:hypothetical protein
LLDTAVAGAVTVSADTTLTTTDGASNQARSAIIIASGHVANITVTAPTRSKIYTIINTSATYTVKIVGSGPTAGVTLGVSEKAIVAWNGSDFVKVASSAISNLTGTLPVANGGTARTVGNYSIYANEIHVGKDGNDTTGDGTLINPVLTITKALTLVGAGRNTVIVHPGSYSESPTVSSANTTIATSELTGANTQIAGTLTLSAAARVSGIKLTNLTITGSGSTYISNCTVDTQVVKSGTNYVEIINSELQCVSGIQISGSGVVSIVGNKCWAVAVSNASASVLIKDCYQVITPSVSAGTLQIDGSAIFAASPTSNAVTSSAGTAITLANSFVLNSAGTSVERVSLAGNYSILNLVYDKTNSTFAGTSLNAIDYFQYINADRVNFNGSTSGITGLIASAVAGTTSLTLPAATDTLVGRATTDTLTNKTLVAPALGTPASGNLSNCTNIPVNQATGNLPVANGGTGLTSFTSGGVVYASSTSALTTGSALTFDGTTLGVGANIALGSTVRYIYQTGAANLQLQVDTGQFVWAASNGSTEQMRLTGTGLGIGTSSPSQKLDIRGSIYVQRDTNPTNAVALQLTNQTTVSNNGCRLSFDAYNVGSSAFGVPSDSASLAFYTGGVTTERMRLDASGNLGIGTSSPGDKLVASGGIHSTGNVSSLASGQSIFMAAYTTYGRIEARDWTGAAWLPIAIAPNGGNVGIGTSSPAYKLDVVTAGTSGARVTTAEYGQFVLTDGTRSMYLQNYVGLGSIGTSSNNALGFAINSVEKMRLDTSGNLGIGTTSPTSYANFIYQTIQGTNGAGINLRNTAGTALSEIYQNSTGLVVSSVSNLPMLFNTNNTERFRIGSAGQLGIGGATYGTAGQVLTSGGASAAPTWASVTASAGGSDTQIQYNSSGSLAGSANFTYNGTTIISGANASTVGNLTGSFKSGRLLGPLTAAATPPGGNYYGGYRNVTPIDLADALLCLKFSTVVDTTISESYALVAYGTTYGSKNAGVSFVSGTSQDLIRIGVGTSPLFTADVNAVVLGYTSNGPRILCQNYSLTDDSSNMINYVADGHYWIGLNGGMKLSRTNGGLTPTADNLQNLGSATFRWATVYAGTGTINTSDRNDKQDIEELSAAEQRVAVRVKGLIRKFRFKDSVAAKGDNARVHFGVIAQDVQDAFTAEGLDASRYGLFCSDTFKAIDGKPVEKDPLTQEYPAGATDYTRLGVRYEELLAFVISAI